MDLLQAISALVQGSTTAEASSSTPSGESGVFMQLLEAAVRGGEGGGANSDGQVEQATVSTVTGTSALWSAATNEGSIELSEEAAERLTQLDALLGLHLAAQLLPSQAGTPDTESASNGPIRPQIPREVVRIVKQLVDSGLPVPDSMRMALEMDDELAILVSPEAAMQQSMPAVPRSAAPTAFPASDARPLGPQHAPSLRQIDRAIGALLRQEPVGGMATGETAAPTAERLQFGRFFASAISTVETALADQPELLEGARTWMAALRSQYVEPQAPPPIAHPVGQATGSPQGANPWGLASPRPATPVQARSFAMPAMPTVETGAVELPRSGEQLVPADLPVSADPPVSADRPAQAVFGAPEGATAARRTLEVEASRSSRWAPLEAEVDSEPVAEVPPTAPLSGAGRSDGRLSNPVLDRVAQAQVNAVRVSGMASGGQEVAKAKELPPVIRVGSAQFVTREAEAIAQTGSRAAFGLGAVSGELADQVATVARAINHRPNVARIGYETVSASATGRANQAPTAWVAPSHQAMTAGDRPSGAAGALIGRDASSDPAARILAQFGGVAEVPISGAVASPTARGVPTGIDRNALLDQLAEGVRAARAAGRRDEIVLKLKPEHLGEVRVAVSVSNGVVSAKLTVQSPAVRSALESEMGLLRQTLADAGLSVDSLQVSVNDHGAQQFTPQRDREFYSGAYRRFQPSGGGMGEIDELGVGIQAMTGGATHVGALSLLA